MIRSARASCLAACLSLTLTTPLLAAQPLVSGAVNPPPPDKTNVTDAKAAQTCLSDLRAFDKQLQKDGYWLGGNGGAGDAGLGGGGYGLGFPLGGYGYDPGLGGYPAESKTGSLNARPGYDVRMLLASASILARRDLSQPCEDVLVATRDIYKQYVVDMNKSGMQMANVPGWRRQQISAAQPVTSNETSFRSDELLGADVRNPLYEALGSVDDLVLSPQTGKIAYLVIARGGVFGIGEKYVAIPWATFKATPNATLLVLDATRSAMDAAPQFNKEQLATLGQGNPKVDAYWKANLSPKSNN